MAFVTPHAYAARGLGVLGLVARGGAMGKLCWLGFWSWSTSSSKASDCYWLGCLTGST